MAYRPRTLTIITILLAAGMAIVSGELFVRYVKPQAITFPKPEFSPQYGHVLPKDRIVDHSTPGKWHYRYVINSYGYRGPEIPLSNRYVKKNIVILGDSYGFGVGVADGEEFSAVLQTKLNKDFDVINLAVSGYGLTQEIRRYYEFGQLYQPAYVILQFCGNDPFDNFATRVTEVQDGRLVFKDLSHSYHWLRGFVGNSFILQNSQMYNLIRNAFFSLSASGENGGGGFIPEAGKAGRVKEEIFYGELLEAFARDLAGKGIKLILISVNGQLEQFPLIVKKVEELAQKKYLTYIDVVPWFRGVADFGSPEGHIWGKKAHALIGEHLGAYIRGDAPNP